VQSEALVSVEYFASDAPGEVTGLRLSFSPAQRDYLSRFSPVSYEVPEMNMVFPLPFENPAFSSATTTFPKPESVNGKSLIISGYAHDQKKTLVTLTLNYQR